MRLSAIRDLLLELPGDPPVVAVDGRSSSGKSTLARRLIEITPGAAVVHTDDIAWRQAVLDWTDLLIDGIIRPVRAGEAVAYRPPRWIEHGRSDAITVPAGVSLLLIEGVGSGRRSMTEHLDGVVWVETPLADTQRRAAVRVADGETTPADYESWMAEELPFVEAERTWERALLTVDGTQPALR
ncbi:uridine kinase family protein [Micromonosporaceae bacterium Da 78-11]